MVHLNPVPGIPIPAYCVMLYLLTSRIGTRLLHADEYTQGDNVLQYSHLSHSLLFSLINHNLTALEITRAAQLKTNICVMNRGLDTSAVPKTSSFNSLIFGCTAISSIVESSHQRRTISVLFHDMKQFGSREDQLDGPQHTVYHFKEHWVRIQMESKGRPCTILSMSATGTRSKSLLSLRSDDCSIWADVHFDWVPCVIPYEMRARLCWLVLKHNYAQVNTYNFNFY